MNAERVLRKLLELKQEQRDNHAETILTDPTVSIDNVRYSQGYINALDWVDLTIQALAKEEQKDDIEDE